VSHPVDWEAFVLASEKIEQQYTKQLELNKKLNAEVQIYRAECETLRKELASLKGSKKKRNSHATLSPDLQKQLDFLKRETERLKSIYPIFDLLKAKQAEVERMKKALQQIPKDHPDRSAAESMVKAHIVERDELRLLIEEAENRFKAHHDQIQEVYSMGSDGTSGDPLNLDQIRVPEH
jgi:hypothetical protein